MAAMDPNHFLALPRPDVFASLVAGAVDTSTLAAHDFDVDNRTGFMPPEPPLARLPETWDAWEMLLETAVKQKLQLGGKPGLLDIEKESSALWRSEVRQLQILQTSELVRSEVVLRRAHHVLTWIMHFFIHSMPQDEAIRIPPGITVPLLQISRHLSLPPVLTYSDNVLYNWSLVTPASDPMPALDNLQCNTLFTSTKDEEVFYLTSARMELRGVEALEIMRTTMDELFVGDDIAVERVTTYLHRLAVVTKELQDLLMTVRNGCDPTVFYREIRPWFKGIDSGAGREWVFEGLELDSTLTYPQELSGPSAGQSSLIHSLDLFLGVDRYSHSPNLTGAQSNKQAFLARMRVYMPRHHRNFLNHLAANPRPLRDFVEATKDQGLQDAYNDAVLSLKTLRDSHLIIVTMYIVQPARKEQKELAELAAAAAKSTDAEPLKGTGGTELMAFLKGVRDGTAGALMK